MIVYRPFKRQHIHELIFSALVNPTCLTGGYSTYVCSSCGRSVNKDYTPAAGHSWVNIDYDWSEEHDSCTATCNCKNCTETLTEISTNIGARDYSEATCISPASEEHYTVFNNSILNGGNEDITCPSTHEYGEVNPDNHVNTIVLVAVTATCTKNGKTEGSYCTDCETILVPQEVTEKDPNNHINTSWTYSPEYEHDQGSTHSGTWTCDDCNNVIGYSNNMPCSTWIPTNSTTCGAAIEYCSDCKGTRGTVPHNYELKQSESTHYQKCTKCDDIINEEEHTPGEVENYGEATCEHGSYWRKKCTVCGYVVESGENTDKLGHTYDQEIASEEYLISIASCKTPALYYLSCICGKSSNNGGVTFTVGEKNPDLHDGVKIKRVSDDMLCSEATCTQPAYYYYSCTGCGSAHSDTFSNGSALGHQEVIIPAVDPTCTETGLTEGKYCERCGITTVVQETIPKAHDYHVIDTVAPTCTEDGYIKYICGKCLDEKTENNGDATGHTSETVEGQAPTCTSTGLTDGKKCSVCGEILEEQQIIPATGHNYQSTVTAPTCTESGYTTHACSNCDSSYTDSYTNPTGHSYEATVTPPTCTEEGYTTHTCSCGHSYTDSYTSHTGHNYQSTVTAPTCTNDGYTTYTCSTCGSSYDDNLVPATGHTSETVEGQEPTCTEGGTTDGARCSVCGAVLTSHTYIPPLGHVPVEDNSVSSGIACERCGEELS